MLFGNLVKEMSKFGNFCKKNPTFLEFWSGKCENLASFAWKMPIQSTSEGKISLAKGIIFTKIGLANGYILKLWAAPPYPKFSREPPPRVKHVEKFNYLGSFLTSDGKSDCEMKRRIKNRPFRNLEKGTGQSAARSDSLSNKLDPGPGESSQKSRKNRRKMACRLTLIILWKNRETKNKHLEDLYSTLFKVFRQ